MNYRTCVIAIIQNRAGEYLLCKTPENRGVFPNQWGIPGGGINPHETMYQALEREVQEEVGLSITNAAPLYFTDDTQEKYHIDGGAEATYMIYLLFTCAATTATVRLNEEYVDYAWVKPEDIFTYDLNTATKSTFERVLK
jgi:nucleoside triphosphatase